jgi:alpha-L-fucosidase
MDILEKSRKAWSNLGYGMFIHFGPNAIAGVPWGDGSFKADAFMPARLNIRSWAELAAEAGMKYAVLTAKHHDGFCLWPSRYTDYSVASSPLNEDIVETFVKEFRKAGLRTGLYYSLWDRNCSCYHNDAEYVDFMLHQLAELLGDYGDILELWFDGAWDKDHPRGEVGYDPDWEINPVPGFYHGERWQWNKIYDFIHKLQPGCLVINNSGSDRAGRARYMPVDIRTVERFDVIWKDRLVLPSDSPWHEQNQRKVYLPLEFCDTLAPGWFWKADYEFGMFTHPSAAAIADWRQRAALAGGNLLLNIGPDSTGRIPDYHRRFLMEADEKYRRLAIPR